MRTITPYEQTFNHVHFRYVHHGQNGQIGQIAVSHVMVGTGRDIENASIQMVITVMVHALGYLQRNKNVTRKNAVSRPLMALESQFKNLIKLPYHFIGIILVSTMINWTAWSDWSPCSKSCGIGMKQRSRNCTKIKSSTRKDVTVYARKVHFKNIEEAHELCGDMIGNGDKFSAHAITPSYAIRVNMRHIICTLHIFHAKSKRNQ